MKHNNTNRTDYENTKNHFLSRYGYSPAPSAPKLEVTINQVYLSFHLSPFLRYSPFFQLIVSALIFLIFSLNYF